jgi:hypothetical protein
MTPTPSPSARESGFDNHLVQPFFCAECGEAVSVGCPIFGIRPGLEPLVYHHRRQPMHPHMPAFLSALQLTAIADKCLQIRLDAV